jgi:hypothetical protein
MAQKIENIVFTMGLDYVKQNAAANSMKLGVAKAFSTASDSTVAANWGSSAYCLAVTTLSSADLTIAQNSSSVTLTVQGKAGIALQSTGVADSVAIFSTVTSYVYALTTCAQQTLGSTSNTVTLSSWVITLTN